MLAIWKREFQNYFLTSIGYVFVAIFLIVGGVMFYLGNILSASAEIVSMLSNLIYLFMLIVPILTMKLLSEEKRNKSDQLLLTSPRSVWDIVLGKFLAACSVILLATVVTLLYVVILAVYANKMYPLVICVNYLGFLLLGFSYVSIGVLMSAMTENQVSAAVLTIGVNLLIQILASITSSLTIPGGAIISTVISWLSLYTRYNDFAAGVFSFANVIYYISFCGIMLFLAVRVIDKSRWSEG